MIRHIIEDIEISSDDDEDDSKEYSREDSK